jgi:hypothetical protein
MFIRTAIIAACLAASSAYGALLVENPNYSYAYEGEFHDEPHENNPSDSIYGSSDGFDGVSMDGSGWTLNITGTIVGFEDTPNGTTLGFTGGYTFTRDPAGASALDGVKFSIGMSASFETSFTTQITFDIGSLALTGGFTGNSTLTVDGVAITNGVPFTMEAGFHNIEFFIEGEHAGPTVTLSQDFSFSATVIPEPSTWALLMGGVAAAWGVRRRKVA